MGRGDVLRRARARSAKRALGTERECAAYDVVKVEGLLDGPVIVAALPDVWAVVVAELVALVPGVLLKWRAQADISLLSSISPEQSTG